MPVMNGFQASLKINELQSKNELEHFPILALTANTTEKDIEQCKNSKMNNYLPKPVSRKQMKDTLEEILHIKIKEIQKNKFDKITFFKKI